MGSWSIDRIIHFDPGDFVKGGLAHFGFHLRNGRYYGIAHQRHFLGLVGDNDRVEWTVASKPVFSNVPNIHADLEFPIYIDLLPNDSLVVSTFGNGRLYRVDPEEMRATLLVDGRALGMVDMGNCVVDDEGSIWVNEVTGCRVWRFDLEGNAVQILGNGSPGFQPDAVGFEDARFNWIYDIRRGPGKTIYVLDSKNFALRVIDIPAREVHTVAGTGTPGYAGDDGDARKATFGSDPTAKFDGPISLSLDEAGNAYVGDRFNYVVRVIDRVTGRISTIAGRADADTHRTNNPAEHDPARANLPEISSMDYDRGQLFVPTDLAGGSGDLVILRKSAT